MIDRRYIDWPLELEVQPTETADLATLEKIVEHLAADDAQFLAVIDRKCGSIFLGGSDERELEKALALLQGKLRGELRVNAPQVGYRETVGKAAEANLALNMHTENLAAARLMIEPLDAGTGYQFENKTSDRTIPRERLQIIDNAIQGILDNGILAGFPLIGLKVTLLEGAPHGANSEHLAPDSAARMAFRAAAQRAGLVLVEPYVMVEVSTPEDYIGDVIGDLNQRRGQVSDTVSRDLLTVVKARAPVAQMFGYANTLSRLTQGQSSYTVRPSGYERVPRRLPNDPTPGEPAASALRA